MPRAIFRPSGTVIDCAPGETLFSAGRRAGIPIPSACNGKGTCGLCRVKVIEGESRLPAISKIEKQHLGNTYFITRLRLACQVTPEADVTVELPGAPPPRP